MASLAPSRYSIGFFIRRSTTVRTRPVRTSRLKEVPMIRSASSRFPLPRSMDVSGAPPMP